MYYNPMFTPAPAAILRVRFKANPEDWRPVSWPIKYPCWCSGYTNDHSTVIAYVNQTEDIFALWPEASGLEVETYSEMIFTSRFPKPDWFDINTSPSPCCN